MLPVGTIVNVLAVLAGGAAGLLAGNRLPERLRLVVFQGLGLCTLAIGVTMILKMHNPLVVIFSVVMGAVAGELLGLERRFEALSERLKARLKSDNELFTDGLVTAFLLFCVGSMTLLGAFEKAWRDRPCCSPSPCSTGWPPWPWPRPTAWACCSPSSPCFSTNTA
jgi:uncharacterized membrane protein YqgA involved in biofilm formation